MSESSQQMMTQALQILVNKLGHDQLAQDLMTLAKLSQEDDELFDLALRRLRKMS